MAYRIAPAVKAALTQATQVWPGRLRTSDGTVGDTSHSKRRSDHNPDWSDPEHDVNAFDLTHDPIHGVDCNVLAERLRQRALAGREPRVKYIIWNHRIFNPSVSRNWRAYKGSNPHTKHMHVSVVSDERLEADTRPWWGETAFVQPKEVGVVFYLRGGALFQTVGPHSVRLARGKDGTAQKRALQSAGVKIVTGKAADELAKAFPVAA